MPVSVSRILDQNVVAGMVPPCEYDCKVDPVIIDSVNTGRFQPSVRFMGGGCTDKLLKSRTC